mgnify:CR=1 FL=1
MVQCYFEDLENIVFSRLKNAYKKVCIAVAWINFEIYAPVLNELLKRKVKVKILLNDDHINNRYDDIIQELINNGAKIKFKKIQGTMHHKFCLIDRKLCLFGSFNWTKNATTVNIENLNICDEPNVINKYYLEFKALWKLSEKDISGIRSPKRCFECSSPIFYVMFFEPDGYYYTKVDIVKMCNCSQNNVYTDYYDISFYNNFIALTENYEDKIEDAARYGDEQTTNQLAAQIDFDISNYLSMVRDYRMGFDIIHAVGVKSWVWYSKDDGEYIYRIIWKERGTSFYIQDQYDISEW